MISDKNFADWEANAFGYGYGTGEPLIIPTLTDFLKACPEEGCYNHQELQEKVGHVECWLLINLLCHQNMIEYGTSPRCGWLTKEGLLLREYLIQKDPVDLINYLSSYDEYCYPTFCNCEMKEPCKNPLWKNSA